MQYSYGKTDIYLTLFLTGLHYHFDIIYQVYGNFVNSWKGYFKICYAWWYPALRFIIVNGHTHLIKTVKYKKGSEGNLPTLDVMWRQEGEKISTDVYRKSTHTAHYLKWTHTHPVAHKLSVVRTLFDWVETHITDEGQTRVAKEKIRTDLRWCVYPNWALPEGPQTDRKAKTPVYREHLCEQPRSLTPVVLPYVQGMIERLQWVFKFKKHDTALHSKPG